MLVILILYSMVVAVSIAILGVASMFVPIPWYWIISPIWITWGITLLAFLICAPIAVYLTKDVKPRGRE